MAGCRKVLDCIDALFLTLSKYYIYQSTLSFGNKIKKKLFRVYGIDILVLVTWKLKLCFYC